MEPFGPQCPKCGLFQEDYLRCKICGTLMKNPLTAANPKRGSARKEQAFHLASESVQLLMPPPPIHPQATGGQENAALSKLEKPSTPVDLPPPITPGEPVSPQIPPSFPPGKSADPIDPSVLENEGRPAILLRFDGPNLRTSPMTGKGVVGATSRLYFNGTAGALFSIFAANLFLSIITAGIYYFWGKTKIRNYIWGETEFNGDRFAYYGTGKELFTGFLRALFFIFLPLGALNSAAVLLGGGGLWLDLSRSITSMAMALIYPFAMVSAYRYRLSRTSWRGIRFSFRGNLWDFVKLFLANAFFTAITLGFYYPFFATSLHAYLVSHAYFGTEKFSFTGRGRDLLRPYLLALLLTIPTLGLCWFWFLAKKKRYFWGRTTLGETRFHCTLTGKTLAGLYLGNLMILVLTLGFGWPWIKVRKMRRIINNLFFKGPLDMEKIQQEQGPQNSTATGEGLAGFLNADIGLG